MNQVERDAAKPRRALCYVSGPMSAATALQREKFRLAGAVAAAELWERDVLHFCPMTAMPVLGASDLGYEDCMAHDVEMLRRSDFVLILPGWDSSSGALREKALAEAWDMPIVYDFDAAADMARSIEKELDPRVTREGVFH